MMVAESLIICCWATRAHSSHTHNKQTHRYFMVNGLSLSSPEHQQKCSNIVATYTKNRPLDSSNNMIIRKMVCYTYTHKHNLMPWRPAGVPLNVCVCVACRTGWRFSYSIALAKVKWIYKIPFWMIQLEYTGEKKAWHDVIPSKIHKHMHAHRIVGIIHFRYEICFILRW